MNKPSAHGAGSKTVSNTQFLILSFGLLLSLGVLAVLLVHIARQTGYEEQYLARVEAQQRLSQRIEKSALAAISGEATAFAELRSSRDEFERLLGELREGVPAQGLPASPAGAAPSLTALANVWTQLRQNADDILANQQAVSAVRSNVARVESSLSQLRGPLANLIESDADPGSTALASELLLLSERIANSGADLLRDRQAEEGISEQLVRDHERLGLLLRSFVGANSAQVAESVQKSAALQRLTVFADVFQSIYEVAAQLIENGPGVSPTLQATRQVSERARLVDSATTSLIDAYERGPGRFTIVGVRAGPFMVAAVGLIGVLFLLLILLLQINRSKRREADSKQQNERNQQAILRLLDEMGDLADGDLTVTATVTEDVTGAIADSINYAIEALRSLVTTINQTSIKVSNSAQESRATAMHLAEASDHQAEQLVSTTYSIKEMALAMDQMASDATESAEIARRSVEIAAKGASTVRHTIQGMDTIREQIQETSKRIKRLGESSQEIGDIVELIDDIADQTNILALNAAMQAAMAGEAGRGFAVVADEVQRLAERSSNATKQIEALVKTIRADTNEAVSSMENTTRDVVYGAKLSEDAGEALKEIENVSQHISERISAVAVSAQKQSDSAGRIDQTMGVIREITTQTSDSTSQTATSIGVLADLAEELQQSVSGFRLPK